MTLYTYTLNPGSSTKIYGSSGTNQIRLKSGPVARLYSFSDANTIIIEAESVLFNVSRSGTTVTLEGNEGTKLILPATSISQTIQFDDQALDLKIDSGSVSLGNQVIE